MLPEFLRICWEFQVNTTLRNMIKCLTAFGLFFFTSLLAENNYYHTWKVSEGYYEDTLAKSVATETPYFSKQEENETQEILVYKRVFASFRKQDDKTGMAVVLTHLAGICRKQKRNPEAELYFEQAEKIAREIKNYEVLKNIYDQYSNYFEEKQDYRNAYKYHVLYSSVYDSIYSQSVKKTDAEISDSKNNTLPEPVNILTEQEILSQNSSSEKKLWLVTFSLFLLILLIFAGIYLKRKNDYIQRILLRREKDSKLVIETEERDRSRLARELNDGIGQQLSAAKLNISALQSCLKTTSDTDKEMLQNAVNLLDDSVKVVRNVSHNMIPSTLIKSGLIPAMEELISKINEGGRMKMNIEIVGYVPRSEPTKEAILFRAIQEVIQNITIHSTASQASVQFVKHESELSIVIEDNGKGFDAHAVIREGKTVGLRGIQSRVGYLNGLVFFDSRPTKGTTVTIEIPDSFFSTV